MNTLFYTILRHRSIWTGEAINIGMICHHTESNHHELYCSNNWQCIQAFDPDIDIVALQTILEEIRHSVEQYPYNPSNLQIITLQSIISLATTQNTIENVTTDKVQNCINSLKTAYFPFDIPHQVFAI